MHHKLQIGFYSIGLILWESLKSFQGNRGPQKAALLAYFCFLAMIPLLLLATLLMGQVIASSQSALTALQETISEVSPAMADTALREVQSLAHNRTWSLVSLLLLFWSVVPLAAAMRSEFSSIFHLDQPTSFWLAKLREMAGVLVLIILLIALASGKVLHYVLPAWLAQLHVQPWLVKAFFPIFIVTGALYMFFLILIPVRLKAVHLLTGALTTAVLLAMVGPALTFMLKVNPSYGVTFGSLKTVFFLLVWVYYAFAAVLFGTEVMANVWRKEALILRTLFIASKPNRKQRTLLNQFVRVWGENEVVFLEGDEGRDMFYILAGSVVLSKNGKDFRTMKTGEYFGEMAMLLKAPRTAKARAGEPGTELALIDRQNFDTVLRENPKIMFAILRELADRLKETTRHVEGKGGEEAKKPGAKA
ncbi:MAG: YhjD/YihY/BrkB family envelope integrity protein [Kiritimatiellae bacterium]|nr:YhjD/YihY/BrkB family envelope integrity protein [Kiritimatiellia bacterium]